MGVLIIFFSL